MIEPRLSDEQIKEAALSRISRIFGVDASEISVDYVFGKDLKASFVSEWKDNELDVIWGDICDVSDRFISKQLSDESICITTVSDYCEHMILCYKTRPKVVSDILREEQS